MQYATYWPAVHEVCRLVILESPVGSLRGDGLTYNRVAIERAARLETCVEVAVGRVLSRVTMPGFVGRPAAVRE